MAKRTAKADVATKGTEVAAAGTGTEAAEAVTANLIKIAGELNTLLGISPAIPTEGETNEVILEKIREGANLILAEDQKDLDAETWEFLKISGFLAHLAPAEKAPATKGAAKGAGKEKVKSIPPKADPNKYTRVKALAEALKSGAEIKDLAKKSDDLYVANGGKSNANIATWDFGFARKLLGLLGYAEEKDGKLILK